MGKINLKKMVDALSMLSVSHPLQYSADVITKSFEIALSTTIIILKL